MKQQIFPKAGFVQFEVRFGNPRANLETVQHLVDSLGPEKDTMLVLPELWSSGFDYVNAGIYARQTPDLLETIGEICKQRGIYIAGSLLEEDAGAEGRPYNTVYVTGPEGLVGKFSKQHLFSYWQEDMYFQPGNFCDPLQTTWGKIGGLVCYDLRFPELSRNMVCNGAGLILVSAQWPDARLDHWRILLQARAIENQVFVIACNSCGETNGVKMAGHSMVIAPDGAILSESGENAVADTAVLNQETVKQVRGRFCTAGERPRPIRDSRKLYSLDRLLPQLTMIRNQGGKIAFTNGCFDILHAGHVAYLEKARQTADCLVVGLNSDQSVRSIKGEGRPVNNETDRARVLSALDCVDFVVLFSEDIPLKLIQAIMPDVLVKGADWPEDKIVGAIDVKSAGGRVVRIGFEHDVSTTQVISRVRQNSSQC